jgi:uncharacterized membrane protein
VFGKLVATFLTGLLALLPLVITFAIVGSIYGKLRQLLGPQSHVGALLKKLSTRIALHPVLTYCAIFAAVVIIITVIGASARRATEVRFARLIEGIPVISKIYESSEKIVDVLAGPEYSHQQTPASLKKVVLARVSNASMLGLLASEEPVSIGGVDYLVVFCPGSPLPASGQNYYVRPEDVEVLEISIEQLTQIALSMGSLAPEVLNR